MISVVICEGYGNQCLICLNVTFQFNSIPYRHKYMICKNSVKCEIIIMLIKLKCE